MLKTISKHVNRHLTTSSAAGRKHNWQSETMMDIGTGKVTLKTTISQGKSGLFVLYDHQG